MDFFRSADMDLFEISVPKDYAWEIMDTFGRLDSIHFVNLNKDSQVFTLVYAHKLKRCEEALRRIVDIIEREGQRFGLDMKRPKSIEAMQRALNNQSKLKKKAPQIIFDIIESDIARQAKLIADQKSREEDMHHEFISLVERKAILKVADQLLNKQHPLDGREDPEGDSGLRADDLNLSARENLAGISQLHVASYAGTILQSEKERLRKLVFRATRGTALTCFSDIVHPIVDYQGRKSNKAVYMVIYQEGEYFKGKVERL